MAELVTEFGTIICEAIQDGIAINPDASPKLCDPHRRSQQETNLWQRRPFVVSRDDKWDLFCLYQSGYQPTLWGTYEVLDDAIREANSDPILPEPSESFDNMDF